MAHGVGSAAERMSWRVAMVRHAAKWAVVLALLPAAIGGPGPALAAEPPEIVHYQGVLRDADDRPLDGGYDMVFRFWSAENGGDEILVDRHLAANGQAVTVSGGLFAVEIGSGEVLDGSGPGTYTQLSRVFADYGETWLEVEVNGETLSPRIRVAAAGYALNAGRLGGRPAGEFLDTGPTSQTKSGRLVANSGGQRMYGIEGYGDVGGGYFKDWNDSGYAMLGTGDRGVHAAGNEMGGYFADNDQSGWAALGSGDRGIEAEGDEMGGYFRNSSGSGIARVAFNGRGVLASGTTAGGIFEDSDSTGYAWVAYGDQGLRAGGAEAGGFFEDTDQSGYAYVGYGENGISAYGNGAGGFFQDLNSSGWAYAGTGGYGIRGSGDTAGGYFAAGSASGRAWLAEGDTGIRAQASYRAGYFVETDSKAKVALARDGYGIYVTGNGHLTPQAPAGRFAGWDGSAEVRISVPHGNTDNGIEAYGAWYGGKFEAPGVAGYFEDITTGTFADVAGDNDTISGNGAKNFVQNHPYDPRLKVVYTALEGPGATTFVRGHGRLSGGVARVVLDESFALVTNPDLGLTAQVTPRSPGAALWVESVTTGELVVRAAEGSDPEASFDYLVLGLRIGFEEIPVIQPRKYGESAPIPSMAEWREFAGREPGLAATSPLARFREMEAEVRGTDAAAIDLSRSRALVAAIHEFDPATDPSPGRVPPGVDREEMFPGRGGGGSGGARAAGGDPEREASDVAGPETPPPPGVAAAGPGTATTAAVTGNRDGAPGEDPAAEAVLPPGTVWLPVAGSVEVGDLVALDPERPGVLRVAPGAMDPGVVGVASGPSRPARDGGREVPVLAAGIARLRVDAGYGEIRPGDLLVSSPTPGHAMRAIEQVPGTVIGKAIEGLAVGTGTIRVLLMPR